jgi:superfamily II DNA helicase RecQ
VKFCICILRHYFTQSNNVFQNERGKRKKMANVERAVEEVLKKFGVEQLKDEQRTILDCLLEGKDCIAVLPTGCRWRS